LCFVQVRVFNQTCYRDKEVVGVFVRFSLLHVRYFYNSSVQSL
jgi:hypothetical protein